MSDVPCDLKWIFLNVREMISAFRSSIKSKAVLKKIKHTTGFVFLPKSALNVDLLRRGLSGCRGAWGGRSLRVEWSFKLTSGELAL